MGDKISQEERRQHQLWLETKGREGVRLVRTGANLSSASLNMVNLRGADLSGTNLAHAYLSEANLREASLGGANLSGATLIRADLGGANLSSANLYETNLKWSNLREANLGGTNLSGALAISADLSGTNLSGADLNDTNLRGANLSEVKIARGLTLVGERAMISLQFALDWALRLWNTDQGLRVSGDWEGFIPVEEVREKWQGHEQERVMVSALEALLAIAGAQGWTGDGQAI